MNAELLKAIGQDLETLADQANDPPDPQHLVPAMSALLAVIWAQMTDSGMDLDPLGRDQLGDLFPTVAEYFGQCQDARGFTDTDDAWADAGVRQADFLDINSRGLA